jgi:lipopolysaccharide biosynthesis protein
MRRRLGKLARWIKRFFIIPIALVLGRLRRQRQIVSVWPAGEIALGEKMVLFMHFDSTGRVRRQLLDYMQDLQENGRTVVFVTNSRRLKPQALAAVQGICAAVIIRRNIGYDFGAWRDAIDHLGLPRANTQEVILANDSVFGPLLPLGDLLRRFNYDKADIWGLTESWQSRYHLQSFFLAFGPTALHAEAFKKFWKSVRPVPAKSYIVRAYEIGVTQAMVKGGLRCAALWTYESLIKLVNRGRKRARQSRPDPDYP